MAKQNTVAPTCFQIVNAQTRVIHEVAVRHVRLSYAMTMAFVLLSRF